MKLKNLFKLSGLAVLLMSFALTGCFPDNKLVYDGPLQVEFPYPQEDSILLLIRNEYEIKFQLIGKQQDKDLEIEFEIDESSTAEYGEDFEIEGGLSSIIPAKDSFGYINITADKVKGRGKTVIINLLGDSSGKVKPAKNYKTFELGLR